MGRIFLEHLGGRTIITCKCKTPITNCYHITSDQFTGSTGAAALYDKAVNIEFGNAEVRSLFFMFAPIKAHCYVSQCLYISMRLLFSRIFPVLGAITLSVELSMEATHDRLGRKRTAIPRIVFAV